MSLELFCAARSVRRRWPSCVPHIRGRELRVPQRGNPQRREEHYVEFWPRLGRV